MSELLTLVEFTFFSAILLLLFRYAGFVGLCLFSTFSIIICNIQVLREAQFCFQPTPVALGTIMCGLSFLTTDIITEHYGIKKAQQSIFLSFIIQTVFVIAMFLTLSYPPKTEPNKTRIAK